MRSGVSALLRADMPAAQDNFSEAVMLDKNYAEAHNKLSALYHRAGNYYFIDLFYEHSVSRLHINLCRLYS